MYILVLFELKYIDIGKGILEIDVLEEEVKFKVVELVDVFKFFSKKFK